MRARRRVRGKARLLVVLGAVIALATGILASGPTPGARAETPAGTSAETRAGTSATSQDCIPVTTNWHNQNWVPTTPEYWPQVVGEQSTQPVTITHGVQEYTENYQTVGGAQNAQIMNVDLTDPNLRFGLVEAGNELVDPNDETISSMADRTGAVAGTNADEFEIHTTGQPLGMVVQNGTLEASPVADWPADLEILNNGQFEFTTETFTGTAADTTASTSEPLAGVNRIDQTGLVVANSFLGAAPISASEVATATVSGGSLTVTGITSNVTSLPQLGTNQEDLFAAKGTAAATWLAGVKTGDSITLTESMAPYGIGSAPTDVATAMSGAAYLVQNGQMAVPASGGGENNVEYPVVGIGVNQAGTQAISVTFNGRESENVATGLTRPQQAQWFIAHGIYNAIEFDSGGSAEMVGRLPGQSQVSVLNTPSDGAERPVANGLFIYSKEASPGPATQAVVNNGQPFTVLKGTTEQVSAYATDAEDNPAADQPQLQVQPSSLATVSGDSVTAQQAGQGQLIVRAGNVTAQVPFTVVSQPGTLSISPSEPDLENSGTQQFTVSGTETSGDTLTLGDTDVSWTVSPAALGTITSGGLFTAAASGNGLATVTASVDGVSASTTVAVGNQSVVVDPMTDTGNWGLNLTNGSTATLSESTSQIAVPGDSGSMDVHYSIPKASGVSQVVILPDSGHTVQVGDSATGQAPTAIGVWIKGAGGTPGTPLANGELTFAEAWTEINGQEDVFYPTTVTYDGWQLITAAVPAGAQLPMTVDFLDFLVINPSETLSGDLYVADLQALYSPRPVTPFQYTAIPSNPAWVQYVESPADFTPGGETVAAMGDSHLTSTDQNSTGAVVMGDMAADIKKLPSSAQPNMVQDDGNLVDPGTVADDDYGKQVMEAFGLPWHTAVGDSDIGQGANPENANWTSVFGDTHYSYTDGNAEFIVDDTAWEGLLASDPYQVPDQEQYQWLVSTLNASTSDVIFIVTHASPYDPQAVTDSQFSDRYEAQMYEQLIADYQAAHPQTHVILLNGQARGFAEQVINPLGQEDVCGLPNFDVSDSGVKPYAPTSQGGFFNYVLFHISPAGTVQFAVQPVLASIAVSAPAASLAPGAQEQLSATGTTPAGDTLAALQVPIADPASHLWSSSNSRVATVDPQTGELSAHSAGTATISVVSGGITGTVTITVT
jgi:exopolysaccharide biosynthesis protein